METTKHDWKLFREKLPDWQEAYMDKLNKELAFVMFLIHQLAEAWEKSPADVYAILKESNILDEYIVPCYDCLHTLGRDTSNTLLK